MFRAAIFSSLAVIFSGISTITQAGERLAGHVIQVAQASPVTKFRALFIGMTMAELDRAIPQSGLTKVPFKNLLNGKIEPGKFSLDKGTDTVGIVKFGEDDRVAEMSLEHAFFDIPAPVPMREFAEKLVKAYNMKGMRYERQTNILGAFWAYRGETDTGERLMVVDYLGIHTPSVEITKLPSGKF